MRRQKWFATKREATAHKKEREEKFRDSGLSIYKRIKGMKSGSIQKPYAVCTHLEWVNTY